MAADVHHPEIQPSSSQTRRVDRTPTSARMSSKSFDANPEQLLTSTPPCSHPLPMPRLPIEIWERIIDIITGFLEPTERIRGYLHACSLTCREWLPRSRFHLFPELRLRSKDHLDHLAKVLSSSPVLQNRARDIRVAGSLDAEEVDRQSWISLFPLRLAPHLRQVKLLEFGRTDLSKVHHSFFQFCTLFRASREINKPPFLWLVGVLWTQFSQVQRLVSAVNPRSLVLTFPTDGSAAPFPVNYFSRNHPRTLGQRCTSLRSLDIGGKRIEIPNCIPWTCLLDANPFLSHVFVSMHSPPTDTEWPEWVRLARNLGALYDRMCLSISTAMAKGATPQTHSLSYRPSRGGADAVASVTFQYRRTRPSSARSGYQDILLYATTQSSSSSSSGPNTSPSVVLRRSLDLVVNVDAINADHEEFAISGKLLGCVMDFADRANHGLIATVDPGTLTRLRGFQNVILEIRSEDKSDSSTDGGVKTFTTTFATEPCIRSWGHLDDALSQLHFSTSLTRAVLWVSDIWVRNITNSDDPEKWSCVVQLAEIYLPRLTGRNPKVLCDIDAGNPCFIHKHNQRRREKEKEAKGQGGS